MKPKKSLGQNFIRDEGIIRRIIEASQVSREDTVLEIGAGEGILTSSLADAAKEVIAMEIDRGLCPELRKKFQGRSTVKILEQDALLFDYQSLASTYKIVANIPYYISTPLIFKFLEAKEKITDITLMLQEELARRIVAVPGNKDYGVLTIAVQLYSEVSYCFKVPKECFFPRPKIDSAVIKINVLKSPKFAIQDEKLFFRLIKTSFAQRRKTLYNNLKAMLPPERLEKLFSHFNLNPLRRGETLSIEEFSALSNFISLDR